MKILIVLSLLLIASIHSNNLDVARNFLDSFFKAYKGNNYKLDPKCLGKDFQINLVKVINSIDKENIITLMMFSKQLFNEFSTNCPYPDIQQIANQFQKLAESNSLIQRNEKYIDTILKLLKNLINYENIYPEDLATALGKYFKLIIKDEK